MNRLLRSSPARLALACRLRTLLVLAVFAIPPSYAWRVNLSTAGAHAPGESIQRLVDIFERDGAGGLAAAIDSQLLPLVRGDAVTVFADPSRVRLVGRLPLWPPEIPDAPGTCGLGVGPSGGATTRSASRT
jgi:hypothetical protein